MVPISHWEHSAPVLLLHVCRHLQVCKKSLHTHTAWLTEMHRKIWHHQDIEIIITIIGVSSPPFRLTTSYGDTCYLHHIKNICWYILKIILSCLQTSDNDMHNIKGPVHMQFIMFLFLYNLKCMIFYICCTLPECPNLLLILRFWEITKDNFYYT